MLDDDIYNDFCDIVKAEMDSQLPKKTCKISTDSIYRKKIQHHKPWWSDDLSMKWNVLREAERKWKNSYGNKKTKYKADLRESQRIFDKSVKSCKKEILVITTRKTTKLMWCR